MISYKRDLIFCDVLRQSSIYIFNWMNKQSKVKEESLTDWLLFDLSERSKRIHYILFNRHEEGRVTGADWEWWFVSNNSSLRIRVQAKIAVERKDLYPELLRQNQHGFQIDKLLIDAQIQNAIPMYAFFSPVHAENICDLNLLQPEGVYLASANRINSEFILPGKKKILAKDILAISNPLSCISCCPLSKNKIYTNKIDQVEIPIHYFQQYYPEEFGSENEQQGVHETIPRYVRALLSSNLNTNSELRDFDIPSEISSLLVFDIRDQQ
jgi:hypothetical protein